MKSDAIYTNADLTCYENENLDEFSQVEGQSSLQD